MTKIKRIALLLLALLFVLLTGCEKIDLSGGKTSEKPNETVKPQDDTVLTVTGGNHLCSYPIESGAKINATTTLAELYATYADSDEREQTQAALLALDRQIALAQKLPTADMLSSLPSLQASAREQLLFNNDRTVTVCNNRSRCIGTRPVLLRRVCRHRQNKAGK